MLLFPKFLSITNLSVAKEGNNTVVFSVFIYYFVWKWVYGHELVCKNHY